MEMIGFMRQLDPLQSKAKPNNSASGLMVLISFSGRFGSIHLDSNWNGVREWPFGRKLEWECGWNPNAAAECNVNPSSEAEWNGEWMGHVLSAGLVRWRDGWPAFVISAHCGPYCHSFSTTTTHYLCRNSTN